MIELSGGTALAAYLVVSLPARGGPVVLVVEDARDTRELFSFFLRFHGFTVHEAADGREGLMQAITHQPDLVMTDLAMPIMDGWEMIRRLRAAGRTRRIPIIVCAGDAAEWPWTGRPPYDARIVKPCGPDALLFEVQRVLLANAA